MTKHQTSDASNREQDAIYQNGKVVGRVMEPEVELESKKIRFTEIYDSDLLVIPDECEFKKYIMIIQQIAYAAKDRMESADKGRVLRGCGADIVGYLDQ